MAWTTKRNLPPNWSALVKQVLASQPGCQIAYAGRWAGRTGMMQCGGAATEVDHIGDPGDHTPGNLRGVCTPCHRRRTEQQAKDAAKVQQSKSVHPAAHATHPALR